MKHQNSQSGFSLIELMIVIVIISIGLIGAVRLARVESQRKQEIKLTTSFENINELLLAYYTGFDKDNNPIKRLPCPARRDLAIDHPNFGAEDCAGVTIVAGNVPHPDTGNPMGIMFGAIPTKELSIATEEAFDVFGGQFLYAVSVDLTNDANFLRNDMSAIQRQDDSGTITGQPLPFIITSMGDTGKGTYNIQGSLIAPCSTTDREGENCNDDGVFLDAFVAENSMNTAFFDDRMGFDGKFFTKSAGVIILNLECPDGEFLAGVQNGEAQCKPGGSTFGGIYSHGSSYGRDRSRSPTTACRFANPLTSACTCPPGYATKQFANKVNGGEQFFFYCMRAAP